MNLEIIEERVISLYDICKLLNKEHRKWKPIIKEMHSLEGFNRVVNISTLAHNQMVDTFSYTKDQALMVGARIDPSNIIKLVNKLKEATSKKLIPHNYLEALKALVISEEEKQLAIDTKAEIGNKREATAMNTASQAVKKANKLELELDKSKEYISIKRMEMIHHGQKFNWRLLKSTSVEMEIESVDIFDANYGTVKAYHKSVWKEAYAVDSQ